MTLRRSGLQTSESGATKEERPGKLSRTTPMATGSLVHSLLATLTYKTTSVLAARFQKQF